MPNQYNVYTYCFGLSGLHVAAFLLTNGAGIFVPAWLKLLLLSNSVFFFAFGLLTLRTRPSRLAGARKKAYTQAQPIMQKIIQYWYLNPSGDEVGVLEVVQKANLTGVAEEDIYRLHDLVPACLLPDKLDDEGPRFDWHRYDLCIISAAPDLKLARRIENALLIYYPRLRVFVDDALFIGPQEELFGRIYRAGSRLCLALVSIHLEHDQRRRHQLNEARQREKISKDRRLVSGRSATYLKPIALDEPGLLFMRTFKDLAPFVEHFSVINDRDRLFTMVVKSIVDEFRKILPHPPVINPEPDQRNAFISYSKHDEVFASALYRDLRGRGIDCWFALEHMMIGEKIRNAIEEALRHHRKVLLILSEDSIRSTWVEFEVELAFDMEKESGKTLLYPIKIDNAIGSASASWARMLCRQRNIGDFVDGNPEAYKRALDRLIFALQSKRQSEAVSPNK